MATEEAARARAGRGGRGGPAEPPAPQKPTETVEQVVGKYVQALGGRQALENARTRVMTGTATMRNLQSFPVTVQEKSTGEYRIEIASQPNPTIRAFDGKTGWVVVVWPGRQNLGSDRPPSTTMTLPVA